VITGAGRGFCSGLDASALQQTTTTGSSSRRKSDGSGMFTCCVGPEARHQRGERRRGGRGFVLTV